MWQRLQTLYLAIATGLVSALFFCNLACVISPDGTPEYIAYTDKTVFKIWLIILTAAHLLALGGYKWRMKQLRVVIFTALASLGFQSWLALYFFQTMGEQVLSFTAVFPLVAAILDAMAAKNILLDEAIVFSANSMKKASRKKKKEKQK